MRTSPGHAGGVGAGSGSLSGGRIGRNGQEQDQEATPRCGGAGSSGKGRPSRGRARSSSGTREGLLRSLALWKSGSRRSGCRDTGRRRSTMAQVRPLTGFRIAPGLARSSPGGGRGGGARRGVPAGGQRGLSTSRLAAIGKGPADYLDGQWVSPRPPLIASPEGPCAPPATPSRGPVRSAGHP